jgi:hypothetical protein
MVRTSTVPNPQTTRTELGERQTRRQFASLTLVLVTMLVVPFGLRALNMLAPAETGTPSYLPALEPIWERQMAFDANVVADLKVLQADYVLIGDSMAGSRVDPTDLANLLDPRGVAPIYYAATGSAFWYLAIKNWIVPSQTHPRLIIIFFRDENLTDPMFRVTGMYRGQLDRVARDHEGVLNDILAAHTQGAWFRVHAFADRLFQVERARRWVEPMLVSAPLDVAARGKARRSLLDRMNTELFKLDALRQMAPADMAQGDASTYDFRRNVNRSVLPEMLKIARRAGIKLAFVRVQRRPEGGKPPAQSSELQQYVRDLKSYLEQNGALFHDDWGDADQPLSIYADGDHVSSEFRRQYTENFVRKNPAFFR